MGTLHTVVQGEHISHIARRYGFTSFKPIWHAGENAALREKRKTPDVLFPGDQVFIPDKGIREEPRPTDQRHRFVGEHLHRHAAHPMADEGPGEPRDTAGRAGRRPRLGRAGSHLWVWLASSRLRCSTAAQKSCVLSLKSFLRSSE